MIVVATISVMLLPRVIHGDAHGDDYVSARELQVS